MDKLKVTTGPEWRKAREEGVLVKLPTGHVAKLRPVTIESLLLFGKVPNQLTALVAEMIRNGQVVPKDNEDVVGLAKEFLTLSTILVQEIFLSPKIVENPKANDEISFFDLSPVDREWAINWANAPIVSLEPFREEQGESVESTSNS